MTQADLEQVRQTVVDIIAGEEPPPIPVRMHNVVLNGGVVYANCRDADTAAYMKGELGKRLAPFAVLSPGESLPGTRMVSWVPSTYTNEMVMRGLTRSNEGLNRENLMIVRRDGAAPNGMARVHFIAQPSAMQVLGALSFRPACLCEPIIMRPFTSARTRKLQPEERAEGTTEEGESGHDMETDDGAVKETDDKSGKEEASVSTVEMEVTTGGEEDSFYHTPREGTPTPVIEGTPDRPVPMLPQVSGTTEEGSDEELTPTGSGSPNPQNKSPVITIRQTGTEKAPETANE
jgi:hypothetical protein